MKSVFALVFVLVSAQAFADVKVKCGSGYGPTESNLKVLIDDEDPSVVLGVGYETMGVYFGFKVSGCRALSLSNSTLFCDQKLVGQVGKFEVVTDDSLYNGPRASVTLTPGKFEITGSCGDKRDPLNLAF